MAIQSIWRDNEKFTTLDDRDDASGGSSNTFASVMFVLYRECHTAENNFSET